MAEENQTPVNLGDLGSASASDIRRALQGQPSPVEENATPDSAQPAETAGTSKSAEDALGSMSNNLLANDDGTFTFVNPYSTNLDVDLDQFETQRRRVSEGSALSGILNGVEGLEEGFTYSGLEDTARRSEEAQGVVNKMKNGMTQLVADTAINVGQGFATLLYGVPSAIVNGDITKLYDNSVANTMDRGTEFLDEFYKIKRGGNQSGMQKAANFIFDDIAGAASFVMGAIATEAAFTALTLATFGGAAPAQAAATVGVVARGTRLVQKALQGGKALMAGTLVDDALRASRALGAKATRQAATAALTDAAAAIRTPMAMQAAARVSRQLITGASMESGMEARHMLNAAVENHKQQYEEMNGRGSFTDEMADAFREEISGHADGVFGANMALVGASNMLMFPKLFGVGLRRGMKTTNMIDTSKLSQRARARLAKNLGVTEGNLPKMIDAARGNTMGRIAGRFGEAGRVTVANTRNALYEGFVEEGGQGAISRSAEDYIAKRYDPRGVDSTVRYVDSFLEGLKGSYTTADGFKEIGIGMLLAFTGVPMYAKGQKTDADGKPIEGSEWKWRMMGGYADARQSLLAQDRKAQALVNLNEKYGDVGGILRQEVQNMHRQNTLQEEEQVAISEGRFKDAKDIESERIFSHAASKVATGRYEQSIREAEQIMEEMSDDELREQLGPEAKNMTSDDLRAHKTKSLASYKARMERAREAYEKAGEIYRGEDPDIHTGVAYMVYMAKDKDAREKAIAEEMAGAIEDMNQDQILDLVRAQSELDMTDEQLGEILTRINRNKDIEKQLKTKLERKIIKNVDPVKAEQRAAEIEALQKEQQDNLDFMQEMMDTMALANNVSRNKYDFSPEFLQDLAQLHFHISRQNRDVTFQEKDIQQLHTDLMAVSADRMRLIAEYNDFIQPGGVQRFEERMIGSIERLADMSLEEQMEARQEAASEQDMEEQMAQDEETPPTEATPSGAMPGQETQGAQGTSNMPPTDDGSGGFAVPDQAPGMDTASDKEFGFPDIRPEVSTQVTPPVTEGPVTTPVPTGVPGNVVIGEPRQVTASENEPPTPVEGPVVPNESQQPVDTVIGSVSFEFSGPRKGLVDVNHGTSQHFSVVHPEFEGTINRLYPKDAMPAGTPMQLTEESNGTFMYRFANGDPMYRTDTVPANVLKQLRLNGGRLDLKVTSVSRNIKTKYGTRPSTGGISVVRKRRGEEAKIQNPHIERRVSQVLPNGLRNITGYGIAGTNGKLLPITGQPTLTVEPVSDDRFSGNVYISTVDSNGTKAWHGVKLAPMGKARAKQILDVLDAFNKFQTNPDILTPEEMKILREFFTAYNLNPNQDKKELRKQVAMNLRRVGRFAWNSEQKEKATETVNGQPRYTGPLLAIEPIGKANTLTIVSHKHGRIESANKTGAWYSHKGNTGIPTEKYEGILAELSNMELNVAQEGETIVPDGNGKFESKTAPELIMEHGMFSNRMPIVSGTEMYNEEVTELEYEIAGRTAIPITSTQVEGLRETTEAPPFVPTDLSISLDTLDFDPRQVSFLMDEVSDDLMDPTNTDPMERAGRTYTIPGLTSRQLRDGINFGAGIMARAFITHTRTVDRAANVSPDYLRRHVKAQLEQQLYVLKQRPQEGITKQQVEAHELYLKPEIFDRLMDMAMLEMLRQSKGIIRLRKGNISDVLAALRDDSLSGEALQESERAEASENPMAAFDSNFAFGVDPKSTLRLEAKMLLMGLTDNTATNSQTIGLAGRRFLNVRDLQEKMSEKLAGVEADWDSVRERLEIHKATYPQFQAVLDAVSDTAALQALPASVRESKDAQRDALAIQDMIRNQLVVFAAKEVTTMESLVIKRQKNYDDPRIPSDPAEVKIWNSNSRNMREHAANDLRSSLVQNGFFDLDGNPNKEKFNTLHTKLVGLSQLPDATRSEALSTILFEELGIQVPPSALTSANTMVDEKGRRVFANLERIIDRPNNDVGVFGRFRAATKTIGEGKFDLEDVVGATRGVGKDLTDMFVYLADYRENFIQNSSKDGDGRTRYHYSASKLVHSQLRDAKERQKDGGVNAPMLGQRFQLLNDDNQSLIGLTYLSGMKAEGVGNERDFHGMERGDLALAQLTFFNNRNTFVQVDAKGQGRPVSKFMLPTLADKHTTPILQAPTHTAEELGIVVDPTKINKPWNKIRFRDVMPDIQRVYELSEFAYNIDREAQRVLDIHAGKTAGMTEAQRGAVGFVMAPGLNPIARQLMEGKIQRKDFKAAVRKQAMIEFEWAMDEDLQYMLEQTKDVAWVESTTKGREGHIGSLNHFQATKKVYSGVAQHVGRPGQKFNAGNMHIAAFVAFVAKYNYEALGVRSGIVRDVMGDPGAFVKLNSEGNIHVTKTAVNMGKRFAAIIAPGNVIPKVTYVDRTGKKVSNEAVNYLVMPARTVTEAAHIKYLREKLGQSEAELAMQQGYDSADAAEYTTAEEHLGILYAQGKITRREMAGVLKKLRKAEELLDKLDAAETEKEKDAIRKELESPEVKLDVTDMAWFQPMKPVTTARDGDHALYVKSASFPLVPGLTHGTELDKLRKFMEKNNIQRAAYDSAVKLGNYWSKPGAKNVLPENQMIPVHVGDTVQINETELNKRVIRGIDRKFMRIQQEVPVSKKLEKVHGSQAAKLFLVDLLDSQFILDGKKVDGRTMHGEYLKARQEELDARLEAFANKYKLRYVDGVVSHTPESIEMMRERLFEEAISREYDENENAHLAGTRTEASPSQDRLENLLKAVVFKEVYEPVISGFSGPIRPEVGIKPLSDSSIDKNDIMWVMKKGKRVFNGNKLKVAQGKQLDQIIMPWKYKAKLEKYMDADGNINADKLPPELLKVFAYRIPGQKKSSSALFEVVGFLPKQYGDTLIVNEELVGRIGQDYDIDKMFGFLYAVDQAEDGTISVVRKDNDDKPSARRRVDIARNRQIDIYLASMESMDINVQKAKHSPVTDGYAADTAEQLELLRTPAVVRGLPMSTSYNADKADAARNGKSSIGVFASQLVLHAQWQGILETRGMAGLPWVYNADRQIENLIVIKNTKDDNSKTVAKRYAEKGRVGAADIVDDTFILNYKTSPVAGKKSDQFSRLLNHSVDNENNQLLAKLGVTPDTWDIWTSMTHVGYNQETIGLLIAMPGVQKYLAAKEHTRRLGITGRVDPGDIIAELLPKKVELSDLSGASSILDKETMLAMIQGTSELSESEQAMMNIAALQAVQKSINIAMDTKRMGEYFRIDTNRPKSLIELDIRMLKAKMTDMEGLAIQVTPVIHNYHLSVAGQITRHIRSTYEVLTNLEGDRLNTRMLYSDVEAAGLYGDSVEHVTNVYKGLKAMAYTELLEDITGRTAQEIREEAHDLKTGGIATRLIEMRTNKPEVANNAFIKQLVAVKGPGQYPHVEFPGDRQLEASDVETQRAFLDLLQSSDPEVKQFAEELVYYAIATTAGRLKSRSFMKFVPAEWLQSKGVNDKVTFTRMNELMEKQSVFNQIVRHNPELAPVVYDRAVWNKATTNRGQGKVLLDSRSRLTTHRGAIRFGDTLYISENMSAMDTEHVDPETGEKYHLLELTKTTTLGDGYLSDEYSTTQLPYGYSGIPRMAKGQAGSFDMPPTTEVGVPWHTNYDVPMTGSSYVPTGGTEGGTGNFSMPQFDPTQVGLGSYDAPFDPSRYTLVPTDTESPVTPTATSTPTAVPQQKLEEPTAVKEGVAELFESNPELANQVYEALGFDQERGNIIQVADGIKIIKNTITQSEELEIFNELKPYLESQASKTNKGKSAPLMIGLGLRWDYTSNNPGKTPVELGPTINNSPYQKNKYRYYDVAYDGQPLGNISDRLKELVTKATGIDATDYDGAIINIYPKGGFISAHNDVDESVTAIKYPVLVLNIGGDGSLSVEGAESQKSKKGYSSKEYIDTKLQSGDAYIFGEDGLNRDVFHRTFPSNGKGTLPTLNIQGEIIPANSYRITITLRRVRPLTDNMPVAPLKVNTDKLNNQITPQQKQEAQQLYSSYLDTIFPNSPSKNILYHIGGKNIEKFDSSMFGKGDGTNASGLGVYFQEDIYEVMSGGIGSDYFYESPTPIKSMLEDKVLTLAVVDIKSEDKFDRNSQVPQEIVIRDVNRIHVLGSKQDIEGFKEFVADTPPFIANKQLEIAEGAADRGQLNAGIEPQQDNWATLTGPPANAVLTRNPITQVNDKLVRNKEAQEKRPNELREFLQKNGLLSNPFLQVLATAQDHLSPEDRVKIVIDPETTMSRGRYVGATNTVHFRTGQEANVRTVTHELMHAMTMQAIGIAAGEIKIDDKQIEAQMKAAVGELEKLFQKARSSEGLQRMGLTWAGFQQAQRGFRAYQKKKQGVALTVQEETDIEFLRQNLDQYYGLVNVKEFVSEAFSNKDFAQRLSKIALNRNETFIDRLMAAVGRVFKALGIMNTRDNAFLKEVYVVSMNIADIQTGGAISKQFGARKAQDVRKDVNPDADLLDDGTFVSDLIDGKDRGPIAAEDIKDIINYKKKRVRQFEELQSRYKDNREFVRRVEGLLVKERQELNMLENGLDDSEGLTAAHILDMGRRELEYARKTIENVDATDAQISMALSALENIYSVVEFYDESRAILADPALKDVATELRRTAAELKDNYLEKARAVLRADAIRELGTSGMETTDKAFETVREVGPLEGRFMDASRLGIPELAFLDKIVRDAAQEQRMQFNARATAYMDKSKAFKKTSYFQKHGWNGMVELDADGNPTPRLITMMSGRFEAEAKRKWQELGNTKEYYDWRNSVTERIDVNALFDISGDVVKSKKNSKYIEHLEGKFGPAATAEFLERQEIMLQDYIDNRNAVFDNLDMTLSPEEAQKAKDLWVLKNNPENAYKRSVGKMKYVKGNTSRFLIDIPLRTVKGKDTGYYDARFMEMMQEKDAIEYYRFYRQQMREMMAMLPSHKMNRDEHLARAGLFVPAISKQMTADLFTKDGLIDMIGNLPESVKASLTIDPELNINKLIDPVTGRPRQELPMYFMGQVDPKTQDYNMDNTFLAFTMMATTYDSKNKIEDKVRMTRSVLSNARMISGTNLRDRVLKLVGAEVTKGYRDDLSRDGMMRVVDTVVDNFYGYQQKTDMTGDAPRWMWNKAARAKIEDLEEQLERTTDDEQKARIEKEIADAIPQVSANKFIHKIQQFIQAKGMAWNVPAAIVNMSFGTISVFRHAAGRADFNETHARQAFMVMTNSTLNNMTLNTGLTQNAQARKIQNMMVNFDVLKDFTEMRYDVRKFVKQSKESGITAAAQQGFKKLRMYEIQRSSEYFTYGHATVAYLKSEMVNGVSLWDAMDDNGVIDIDGYRPGEEQHLRIMNRIDQINKRIHGNYDPNSPIAIKRTMLGRLMMQFRSWFPEAVAQRYETEKYDPYLERKVKGTYQTMFFSGEVSRNLKAMLPMLLPSYIRTANMDKMSDDISEVDQENIRKFAASLRQYAQVAILLAVLRAMKDDEDDDEATRMLNRGLNLTSRLENDLALFGSPGAMIDMTQGDFLAAIGFLADIEKFFDATMHAIQGEPTIETGVYAGTNRMWHHFQKLVPHLGAVQRMVRNAEQDMSQ